MEILKTSEELEKQILEDARRKASRVLEAADRDAAAISRQWEKRSAREAERMEGDCEAKLRALRRELEDSLPLEFMRTRLSATERTLTDALERLFAEMPVDQLSGMLGRLLEGAAEALRGARISVTVQGLSVEQARRIVTTALPEAVIEKVEAADTPAGTEGPAARGMIVATTDRRVRFRCTVAELTARLLEERRGELVEALLGKQEERSRAAGAPVEMRAAGAPVEAS